MTRPLALVVFLLSALLLASAQAVNTASIAGTVSKEPGSEPLKKVLVQVVAENQTDGGNYTASTDSDGHFRVDNLVPGRYRIFFERTGFVEVNGRGMKADVNVFTVQAGQSIADLLFRMLPTAVISGRITDEDGDPMAEVRVMAQKKRPGKATRENVASAGTNDLGEYRLSGLFPGQYVIVAIPAPDFRDYEQQYKKTSSPSSPANNADGQSDPPPDTRYLTTYYPGVYDAMQASSVALKAGDDVPINMTLMPAQTYCVRGIVAGVKAGQKATVELASRAGDSIREGDVGTDGQFEVRGVGPGSYVLTASVGADSHPLSARQDVSVVAADVDGVKLAPQPSFTFSGHLRSEGNAPGDITQYSVNLHQVESQENNGFYMSQQLFGANAPVDRLGNFEWKGVNPGNYVVQLFGGNGQNTVFLKSVVLGGRDVAGGFTASGPAMIDLVLSMKGGIVEGTVIEQANDVDKNRPVANATVVVVPEEKYRKFPGRFGSGATDQHGNFVIRGLAPGSYTLFAWQDVEEGVWRDPDFLKSQEANGTTVKVEEGSNQTFELKLSPAGEDWR